MRLTPTMRRPRRAQMAAGALLLAVPSSAVALTARQTDAQSASPTPTTVDVARRQVAFGSPVTVTGAVPTAAVGRRLELQFAPAGSSAWMALQQTTVGRGGHYRFHAVLRHTSLVRVVDAGVRTPRSTPALASADSPVIAPSPARRITVAAGFQIRPRTFAVFGGQSIEVGGRLLPALAGRRIRLMTRAGRGFRTIASAMTGPRGGFRLRYAPPGSGTQWLRVSFAGDRANGRTWAMAGPATRFVPGFASWYNDGGQTACGFHAGYGVANLSLPCGAQVTFRYGGRQVTATVDDRGPYVGGREWDLNQNTAGALGFSGVDAVWASS
ncbi:MAG: septal ring lytic transglycosylase RlpA family protein [Solirubrobacteraceae bacterium]